MKDDFKTRIFGNELKYVKEVLDGGFRSSNGARFMGRLEETFAHRFGVKFAIAQVNGTTTLHSVLEAAGIRIGDEVIVPPLTMSATTFAVLQANATPVFADVDPETFLIDASSIEKHLTPRTRAIITVALYGLSPDMKAIMAIANRHNLLVLEDNAQCFLGEYRGKIAGTLGHAASFSFQSSKHLTSGEGGIVITNEADLAGRIRMVTSLGYAGVSATQGKITKTTIQDPNYSRHVSLGWNYRMPELCAAVALAQVENIDALVERRIEVAKLFAETVAPFDWLIPQKVEQGDRHSYWTFPLLLNHPSISWHAFQDRFRENGGHGIYAAWKLTYLEPLFQKMALLGREKTIRLEIRNSYRRGLCPIAEQLQPKLLQLKTNYWDFAAAREQARALEKTLKHFSMRRAA